MLLLVSSYGEELARGFLWLLLDSSIPPLQAFCLALELTVNAFMSEAKPIIFQAGKRDQDFQIWSMILPALLKPISSIFTGRGKLHLACLCQKNKRGTMLFVINERDVIDGTCCVTA